MFKIYRYVTDFDPASYRLKSTLPLFRNNTATLFLFRLRNCPAFSISIHKCDLFF